MATPPTTFDALRRQIIQGREIAPVYLFHGEEPYYADALSAAVEGLVPAEARDFDLTILYAPQVTPAQVADACCQLPVVSDRRVVIVREMQSVRSEWQAKLSAYAKRPNPRTVLALVCRGDKAKGRGLATAVTAGGGAVFEGRKLSEAGAPAMVVQYIKAVGLNADPKATQMICDAVGADLGRLHSEVDKLASVLPPGSTVTPQAVETHVGVSRQYNSFELVDAVARRDHQQCWRITRYLSDAKDANLIMVAALLFSLFRDVAVAYFTTDQSEHGLMNALGLSSSFMLRRVQQARKSYNAYQTLEIVSALRQFDRQSKGQGSRQPMAALFQELMFRILNAQGKIEI